MKKLGCVVAALAAVVVVAAGAADASVLAKISIEKQTMNVYVDGDLTYTWKVSTARHGYVTPRGSFRAQWLDAMHLSSQYENAPMPYSVFFNGGYAIHGSYETRYLGHPASHGCVRLAPGNAAKFYGLVEDQGVESTRVVIN